MTLEWIQIVEDKITHAALLSHAIGEADYRTNIAFDGLRGLSDVQRLDPTLVILDVMLPEVDGHEICRRLKADLKTRHIPIILVSALGSEEDRLTGFRLGVSDYIVKPFSPREVVARVSGVLRRVDRRSDSREQYLDGSLRLEQQYVVVNVYGKRLDLTYQEWIVLRRLCRRPGETVAREELISLLWDGDDLIHEHELDRLIGALKWKFHSASEDGYRLSTVTGVGYSVKPERTPP